MERHQRNIGKPELLAPAGSPEALAAAIEAGADAVYFGGAMYSNRMRAKNFDADEISKAIELCNSYSVASYVTMNTRLRDRELPDAVETAKKLWCDGVSAFIVADAGFATLLKEQIPDAEIHASTQMTGVSASDAEALRSLGFSRMVCPRELSQEEIFRLVKDSPIEIEMFIHGAHCVSVSGQCLMSWAMGGRSGNRGECAQPCRLPYKLDGCRGCASHPLSLKDMCLASHVPELIKSGVSSLKIEGRLKSADYVYGVTRIYRRLLDENRAATKDEIRELDSIFSRDGFSDGYFRGSLRFMNGMRPEGAVSEGEKFTGLTKRIPVSAHAKVTVGENAVLSLTCGDVTVTATGDVVQSAKTAPATSETIYKSISKLGSTPYSLAEGDFTCETDGLSFMTASQLNALRRDAAELLDEKRAPLKRSISPSESVRKREEKRKLSAIRTAEFLRAADVPNEAYDYFDVVFLPEGEVSGEMLRGNGKVGLNLPLYASDPEKLRNIIDSFAKAGGRYTLAHSYSEITLSRKAGLVPVASLRLNVTNVRAAEVMGDMGAEHVILSPELKSAAVRDISRDSFTSCGAVVYGKIPMMLLKRCLMADAKCSGNCGGAGCVLPKKMSDRRGASLDLLPIGDRMNLIVNPHPLWSADRGNESLSFGISHFIFTTEKRDDVQRVIDAYKAGLSPEEAGVGKIKRT